MKLRSTDLARRSLLIRGAAAAASAVWIGFPPGSTAREAATDHGRVDPPLSVPELTVRCAVGGGRSLPELLRGRATAVHLMYTQCSSVCPIQGAIFQRVQQLLGDDARANGAQLLSLSVDPRADTPAALRAWLSRFHAGAEWIAAAPHPDELAGVQSFFAQGGNAVEAHATRVSLIDRNARLVWRTAELPAPEDIAQMLQALSWKPAAGVRRHEVLNASTDCDLSCLPGSRAS